MASETYQLAIFLSLKDAASGQLDRVAHKLQNMGKEGRLALKEYEALRQGLSRHLAIGGIGLAGLAGIKQGVQVAANFQTSVTDLRATLMQLNSDGTPNLVKLSGEMQKAEKIAVELGNKLPGTTAQFSEMLMTLKMNGLEATTIFNGAGEAVGNLAVANNAIPKDIAKDFARFGQLYQLKADEYVKAADLFSRIYTAKGVESSELIEGAKFFQGRAGANLQLTGLKGAEQSTRFLAFMRQQGMEGSEAGTSSSTFLKQLVVNKKALEGIRKEYGVTLQLFDKKGQFLGFENTFKELEKLRKLNPQQLFAAVNKIGGEEGARAGTAMIQAGLKGWQDFNAEINKTIGLQQKVDMKSQDFNNKLEALTGTASNLAVTVFTPLLPPLTSLADKANTLVGSLQEFSAAHPTLTTTTAYLLTLGSAGLVAYSAFRTMQTGWRMWRLMSAISSADGGLLTYLTKTKIAADAAGTSMAGATTKATGLRGALSGLTSSPFKIAIQVASVYGLMEVIQWTIQQAMDAVEAREGAERAINAAKDISQKGDEVHFNVMKKLLDAGQTQEAKRQAQIEASSNLAKLRTMGLDEAMPTGFSKLPMLGWEGQMAKNLSMWYGLFFENQGNPFRGFTSNVDKEKTAQMLKTYTPTLRDPSVMLPFLQQLEKQFNNTSDKSDLQTVKAALAEAFPQSFTAALQQISTQQPPPKMEEFKVKIEEAKQSLDGIQKPVEQTTEGMTKIATSANRTSQSLDLLSGKLQNWQPPSSTFIPPSQGGFPPFGQSVPFIKPPHKASGGRVLSSGLAYIHSGEDIVPANVTSEYDRINSLNQLTQEVVESSKPSIQFTYSPTVNVYVHGKGDKKEIEEAVRKALSDSFADALYQHEKDIDRIITKNLRIGRERS